MPFLSGSVNVYSSVNDNPNISNYLWTGNINGFESILSTKWLSTNKRLGVVNDWFIISRRAEKQLRCVLIYTARISRSLSVSDKLRITNLGEELRANVVQVFRTQCKLRCKKGRNLWNKQICWVARRSIHQQIPIRSWVKGFSVAKVKAMPARVLAATFAQQHKT